MDYSFLDHVDARKGRWRDAAELLRSYAPKDMAYDRLNALLDAVEAAYDTRTQRMMRHTLDGHDDVKDRVSTVISLIDDLGLQSPPPVEPLPEIDERDVNLVTWMAIVPRDVSRPAPSALAPTIRSTWVAGPPRVAKGTSAF